MFSQRTADNHNGGPNVTGLMPSRRVNAADAYVSKLVPTQVANDHETLKIDLWHDELLPQAQAHVIVNGKKSDVDCLSVDALNTMSLIDAKGKAIASFTMGWGFNELLSAYRYANGLASRTDALYRGAREMLAAAKKQDIVIPERFAQSMFRQCVDCMPEPQRAAAAR